MVSALSVADLERASSTKLKPPVPAPSYSIQRRLSAPILHEPLELPPPKEPTPTPQPEPESQGLAVVSSSAVPTKERQSIWKKVKTTHDIMKGLNKEQWFHKTVAFTLDSVFDTLVEQLDSTAEGPVVVKVVKDYLHELAREASAESLDAIEQDRVRIDTLPPHPTERCYNGRGDREKIDGASTLSWSTDSPDVPTRWRQAAALGLGKERTILAEMTRGLIKFGCLSVNWTSQVPILPVRGAQFSPRHAAAIRKTETVTEEPKPQPPPSVDKAGSHSRLMHAGFGFKERRGRPFFSVLPADVKDAVLKKLHMSGHTKWPFNTV
nr:hypothetical protein BaRGS_013921 [Batillaria attramentaria]